MNKFFETALWLAAIGACTFAGCKQGGEKEKLPSPAGYDLQHPVTVNLKASLDEISGIYFYPKDTSVFAINDENGTLFKIYLRSKVEIKEWTFSDDADYEDIVLVDSTFFALHSNGNISKFRFNESNKFDVEECDIPLKGKNEFETLYYTPDEHKLVLICKDCRSDKENVPAYSFDPNTKDYVNDPVYTIEGKSALDKLRGSEKRFKPSAAAINPRTKELYIVSSVNKSLVIASLDGKVKEVYPLDPAIFKQPEGITFTPDGTLLISNEAAEVGSGNILIFKYKAPNS